MSAATRYTASCTACTFHLPLTVRRAASRADVDMRAFDVGSLDTAGASGPPRFAWMITGSGHLLEESLALAGRLPAVDLLLSRAAEEVLEIYGIHLDDLRKQFRVIRDKTASAVPVGLLYDHHYHTVVIAPATSNTVAKCAFGISDSLPTNMLAQAGKLGIPGIVFACDTEPVVVTMGPQGWVKLMPRNIELENVQRLRGIDHARVACSIEELREVLERRLAECGLAWNTSSS